MLSRRHIILAIPSLAAYSAVAFGQEAFGHFVGEFDGHFNPGGRTVTLLRELSFIDPDGLTWTAPNGLVVDGASIPRPLWSIVGSPYTGNYRRASVIHDSYCHTKERSWRATHYIFYLGSRADGVGDLYAKLLYGGVMAFGPRWGPDRDGNEETTPELNQEEFNELKDWILQNDPKIQEINRRVLG
jgi:Protein of unknown function (DUF1353)